MRFLVAWSNPVEKTDSSQAVGRHRGFVTRQYLGICIVSNEW